ncbi:NAD(P)/FAD-dependent oxidoreductase [Petropleomorpha daqingensis]|uniref:NADH dehydrogenase n=1 Tax=Petropleomorpha daqingensis TaxID=2026353 RepID=A0A853CF22_9ACTN|nr:NAD(P)/FAD-dependent oxidoreductase [Petropleomorpha daqingensis]NYJ06017.1 NADH dehydrogenase [Petropleomorpha daqingensis]
MSAPVSSRPSVVVVGGGFAGFFAARTLERLLPVGAADLTMISATDHLCYSPLLPEVAAGRLDPRRIAVPLHSGLRRARVLQATVEDIDFDGRTLRYSTDCDPATELAWDRLAITTGSVTRILPTPGLEVHALGLKNLVEAVYVRDHVLRQLELADSTSDLEERRARLTFVVVGAGYAGTETAAQLQWMTIRQLDRYPRLRREDLRWVLMDLAPSVLPEMGPRLSSAALDVVRQRGMEVMLETTVTAMDEEGVTLGDGRRLATRTVLWTVGVTPPPLVQELGLPVSRGRLVVDEQLRLREDVWAAGDSAAAEDPFSDSGSTYPPTAQNAQRQGVVIAHNIAASLGHGSPRPYRHRDLGLVADLGRTAAVARPLGLSLTGLPAKVVTKAYHLYALPTAGNRLRVAADWAINTVSRPIAAQLGLVDPARGRLGAAETRRRSRTAS